MDRVTDRRVRVRSGLRVRDYFRYPESTRPTELVFGVVRELPAPRYEHQYVLTHLGALMDEHVRRLRLGALAVAPVDVVLDQDEALVIQPDIVFVSESRRAILRERVWGAPDLVVEVLSPRTARRDRTTKMGWYRRYGVRECWIVDAKRHTVDVINFEAGSRRRRYRLKQIPRSAVLTAWDVRVDALFD